MPILRNSAVAAIRTCELSITEYSLLVACQRMDAAMRYALDPLHVSAKERLLLLGLATRGYTQYSTLSGKWELTALGRVSIEVVALLSDGELCPHVPCEVLTFPQLHLTDKK